MKPTYIIKEIKAGRDTIYVYAYISKNVSKTVTFKTNKGLRTTGYFRFANRITSGNGKITHDQQEFNTPASAWKNIISLGNTLNRLFSRI